MRPFPAHVSRSIGELCINGWTAQDVVWGTDARVQLCIMESRSRSNCWDCIVRRRILLDRRNTCDLSRDFVARVSIKSQTLRLASCTLRLCRLNKHSFCTTFPFYNPFHRQLRNCKIVLYLIFSRHLGCLAQRKDTISLSAEKR